MDKSHSDRTSRPHDGKKRQKTGLKAELCALPFLVAPVLFLRHYQIAFGYSPHIVLLGWFLVVGLVMAVYTLTLCLAFGFPNSPNRLWVRLFAGCLLLVCIGVGTIYQSAYISNSAWGDTITYEIALTFLKEPAALTDFLPFSTRVKIILLLLVLGSTLVLGLAAALLCRHFSRCLLLPLIRKRRSFDISPNRRWWPLLTIAAVNATFLGSVVTFVMLNRNMPERFVGEPISSFLKWYSAADSLQMDNNRMKAALEDRIARETYPAEPAFDHKNIVLIMADSLRADRMGIYGYTRDTSPFLSGLFQKGLLHKTQIALSTCSESYCGIASTLASRPYHQVSAKSLKLHMLLQRLGYRINFLLSGDHRSWKYIQEFYGKEMDLNYDHKADKRFPINDDRMLLAGLQTVGPFSGQPAFFFFFMMSSHVSGTRLPEYEPYGPHEFDSLESFWNEIGGTRRLGKKVIPHEAIEPREMNIIANHYDNGVLQTDQMIAAIFKILEDKGYLQNSMVIIMGDHGDGLGEHGHLGHTRYLYQEDIRIPLLIYDRDLSVYKNSRFATQIDIAPTVLDRLELPIPASWEGRSLLQPPQGRLTLHQTRRGAKICRAVVSSKNDRLFKFIKCGTSSTKYHEEVYNLIDDPGERTNLLATTPTDILAQLRWELDSRFGLSTNRCNKLECRD